MSVETIFAASALAGKRCDSPHVTGFWSEQTCAGQTTGYKYVTRLASNVQYEVICGADYYVSDLSGGVKWPGSFEGCLAECDANAEFKSVSCHCYHKGRSRGKHFSG